MVASLSNQISALLVFSASTLTVPLLWDLPANAGTLASPVQQRIATVDDPDNHITTGFDGIARLFGPPFHTCGASLLSTGKHVLTAGHCLFSFDTGLQYSTTDFTLDFGNGLLLTPERFYVRPDFDLFRVDNDIAIIELPEVLPATIARYDIYRDSDEFGQIGTKVGFGGHGTGDTGVPVIPESFDDQKRVGQNVYDAPGELLNGLIPGFSILPGTQLAYDFDNGLAENDAFGTVFGADFVDLGLGINEVNSALGDSGGPTFINGLIAGLTSYGFGGDLSVDLLGTDVTPNITDSSFGEISVDTRVSAYAKWIDNVLADGNTSIPEPGAVTGMFAVGMGLLLKRKRSA